MENEEALILIVDDAPMNLKVLGSTLQKHGYRLAVAMSGEQAVKFAEHNVPDCILLDVMMPDMDGYETCRRLKANEKTAFTPIIFLTAKTELEDIVHGFEVGGVDYITKPFSAAELLSRVKTQVTLKWQADEIRRQSETQRQLLHILCHDLLNPLTAIQGSIDFIMKSPEHIEKFAPLIKFSTTTAVDIIAMVRNLRAVEEKKLELAPVNLRGAVDDALSILGSRAEEKNIGIEVGVPDDCLVLSEKTSLVNSVIANLITNAVKFSVPNSSIAVTAEIREHQRLGPSVVFSVRDSGIGMPPQLVNDLFDLSKPTNRVGTSGESGTGFGMPLVKRFIECYGGIVDVESRDIDQNPDSHGTTVRITLRKA